MTNKKKIEFCQKLDFRKFNSFCWAPSFEFWKFFFEASQCTMRTTRATENRVFECKNRRIIEEFITVTLGKNTHVKTQNQYIFCYPQNLKIELAYISVEALDTALKLKKCYRGDCPLPRGRSCIIVNDVFYFQRTDRSNAG